jgi:hypothetical protein
VWSDGLLIASLLSGHWFFNLRENILKNRLTFGNGLCTIRASSLLMSAAL